MLEGVMNDTIGRVLENVINDMIRRICGIIYMDDGYAIECVWSNWKKGPRECNEWYD